MPHNRSVSLANSPVSAASPSLIHSRGYSETPVPLGSQPEDSVIPKAPPGAEHVKFLNSGLLSPPASDDEKPNIRSPPQTITNFQNALISPCDSHSKKGSQSPDSNTDLLQPIPRLPSSLNDRSDGRDVSQNQDTNLDDSLAFPVEPYVTQGSRSSRLAVIEQTPKKLGRYMRTTSSSFHPSTPPDRFIPSRNSPQPLSETFRSTKSPHLLSGPEKLLRQKSCTPDPFSRISPRRVREGQQELSFERRRRRDDIHLSAANAMSVVNVSRNVIQIQSRDPSTGSIWNIGGDLTTPRQGPIRSISDGRGGWIGAGTNAPMYTANFLDRQASAGNDESHEGRLAAALDIDQNMRLLNISQSSGWGRRSTSSPINTHRKPMYIQPRTKWVEGEWVREGSFSLLDAPRLRDDFYCSVLAYCYTSRTLAVGLANRVYLWSEAYGVQFPRVEECLLPNTYVTSLSFSSTQGGHSILATGRSNGQISLWSLYDSDGSRFRHKLSKPIACVAFKPVTTERESVRFGSRVPTEELLVGDDAGMVFYFSIEWMSNHMVDIHGWSGHMTMMASINVHTQQICGLAWSKDGEYFATGANDNGCCLFDVKDLLKESNKKPVQPSNNTFDHETHVLGQGTSPLTQLALRTNDSSTNHALQLNDRFTPPNSQSSPLASSSSRPDMINIVGGYKHKWIHGAAIKAIAFCPWQSGLLATGGGSNDRAIHFYHTISGACLATIDVQAQVTSLIWSTSRREIAATFGYAQPEHPYRIAVFSWPDCSQVVAIPWNPDMRALSAIAYPGGPNESSQQVKEGETWWSRTAEEGCIVVASSDESIKFHEVWSGGRKPTTGRVGLLGGSDILEALEGIEKDETNVIR